MTEPDVWVCPPLFRTSAVSAASIDRRVAMTLVKPIRDTAESRVAMMVVGPRRRAREPNHNRRMRLAAYVLDGHAIDIRPAPPGRGWMDATPDRYAYRCLPLSIANMHGWEVLCQAGFTAAWNGADGLGDIGS